MKSNLAHQLVKIHHTTGSTVEFEYIYPPHASDGQVHYKWLWTHLLKDPSTRGLRNILWTVTNSESTLTLITDGKLLEYHDIPGPS